MGLYRRSVWLGLPMVLCCAAGAAARPAPSEEPAPPVFGADVTLVAVPVFVTDKSGKAVAGLTADDFEVYDGGRRVPIAAFQAVDVDVPVAAASQSELPVAVQAAAHRQFLLLFDLQFSHTAGIRRARAAATRFVRDSLGSSDLVAVATYGSGGLKMLTNFTSDRAYAARAIEGLGLVDAVKSSDPLGLSGDFGASAEGLGQLESLADQEIAAQDALLKEALKRAYGQRVNDFLEGVEELVQALSSFRGRKQIVLLSGGFGRKAWVGPETEAERFEEPRWMVVQDRMKEVFRAAGQSDVVIHTVSLAGLEGPVDVSSRTGRSESVGAGRETGRETLAALAENTGGRFVLPTNDFARALGEMEEVSRHYYVLAFQPAEPAARRGRPRSLKVRVHGAGRSVSHRTAYVVPASSSGSDAAAGRSAAAEAIGKGLSGGPLSLRLVAMPYRDREGGPNIPAVLYIDRPALAAVARGERLDLQVYGYAMTAGRVLDTLTLETTLDLSKLGASVRSDGVRVLTAFAVSPGAVELRFFVRAGAVGDFGSIRHQVEVPATVEGETRLSPPVLILPPTGKIVVPLPTRNGPQLEIPFRLGSTAFVPDAVALEPGRARDLGVFVWRARTGSRDPLEVTGEIARPGEAPLPLRIEGVPRVVPDADGFDRYVVTVVPPVATPGAYALRLTFREAGTGLTARSETQISMLSGP
jgi:VWFA-related protein